MSETVSTSDNTGTDTTETSSTPEVKTTEWYEAELSKVRGEAAKYRTEKRDAVEAAVNAAKAEVTQEFEAKLAEATQATETVKAEASQYQVELTKLRTALGTVDAEVLDRAEKVAGLLHGVTVDEIQAQAENVKGLLGESWGRTPAIDPSPEGKPLALNDDDGLLNALKGALGI